PFPSVRHADGRETAVEDHAAKVRILIAELPQRLENLLVNDLEISDVGWNVEIVAECNQTIEYRAKPSHRDAFLPHGADAVDHVMALFPETDELRDEFGRVLKIGRDEHDDDI